MAISSFRTQPALYSMHAAYRPIIIQPNWDTISTPYPEVVYCDVYVISPQTGVKRLIRTLTSTNYIVNTLPYWTFDIQDVAQEFLRSALLSTISNVIFFPLNDYGGVTPSFMHCACYFRYGVLNSDGFVEPNAPPNASSGVGPVNFFVFNAALQQEEIQNLQQHLQVFRKAPFLDAGKRPLPLTHRQDGYIIGRSDFDHFSFFYQPIDSTIDDQVLLLLKYRLAGDPYNSWRSVSTTYTQGAFAEMVNHIPSGTAQLESISWYNYAIPPGTFIPTEVVWDKVVEYYIQVCRIDGGLIPIFTTTKFKVDGCESAIRVRFQNALGYFDCVNFEKAEIVTKTSSSSWQKQNSYPLNVSDGGFKRLNVASNETYSAVTYAYPETMMEWLRELFDAPLAWIEVTTEDGQKKSIPIKIEDGDFVQKKIDGRFLYETSIQFTMANDNIRQRN